MRLFGLLPLLGLDGIGSKVSYNSLIKAAAVSGEMLGLHVFMDKFECPHTATSARDTRAPSNLNTF